MLRSLYVMLDYHIVAADGELGLVRDFLFDDESWIVHYLVAAIPGSPASKEVLIPPFVAGPPDWETKTVPVLLTREQLRTSSPLECDMPISRQREAGMEWPGSHLRSMREVLGYGIHAPDGEAGNIDDLIIEDTLWGVHHAVVTLKEPRLRTILISPQSIRTISWPGKAAWVNLTLRELEMRPDFDAAASVNQGGDHRLYDYYGRPICQPPPFAGETRPEAPNK